MSKSESISGKVKFISVADEPARIEDRGPSLASDSSMDRRRFLKATAITMALLSSSSELTSAADEIQTAVRTIKAVRRYLNFPVRSDGTKHRLKMTVNGKVVREFDINLTESNAEWWAFTD